MNLFITLVAVIVGSPLSTANAIWPFDEFTITSTNETDNQASEDPFEAKLPDEHGELPEEDLDR